MKAVPSPSINGNSGPSVSTTETYSIASPGAGNTYQWNIVSTLGNMSSGQGTDTITVDWTSTGDETLEVVEDNGACMSTPSQLPITVV